MTRTNLRRRHSEPRFESVTKLSSLPIVEGSMHIAGNVYERIKRSNSLISWSLDAAEHSLALAAASAKPAISTLNGPITTIDHLLCKGIDIVEQRVPAVHIPPQQVYFNTRDYVTNNIVRPVLERASSMSLIGSQAANAAVDKLDNAIIAADRYVDKYLPEDPADKAADVVDSSNSTAETQDNKAARTIKHGARFSKKLQHRLTKRTLLEIKALKAQGMECLDLLLYIIKLSITDPKLALQQAKELWAILSLPEPGNQAPPANLQQLLVLLTRESARRVVHLCNRLSTIAAGVQSQLGKILVHIYRLTFVLLNEIYEALPGIAKRMTIKTSQLLLITDGLMTVLGTYLNQLLDRLASIIGERPMTTTGSKIVPVISNATTTSNANASTTDTLALTAIATIITTTTTATAAAAATTTTTTAAGDATVNTNANANATTIISSTESQDVQRNHNNHNASLNVETSMNGIE